MRHTFFAVVLLLFVCGFACAQDQPPAVDLASLSRPMPGIRAFTLATMPAIPPVAPSMALVESAPAPTSAKKVVDGKFIFLGVMTMLSTAADIEFTQHCLKEKTCHELNPTLPLSRWGMYATNTPVNLAVMYWSYRRKRDGKFGWWLPMTADIGIHGGGLATNVRFAF